MTAIRKLRIIDPDEGMSEQPAHNAIRVALATEDLKISMPTSVRRTASPFSTSRRTDGR